ncbi:MAG: hypothetical protein V4674_00090 [Patescibacteria group bacterium]
MTKEEASIVRHYMSALGRRGGRARLTTMTPKARTAVARAAAEARWKRHREQRKAGAKARA